jgi:phosphatidylglycerol---prolipoprotein diacylglyceryl transferase
MIKYPSIDPVIFSAGPVAVRWYGLMYVIGFAVAWWLGRKRASSPASTWTAIDVDDLIFYSAIGVIVGGRLGWITAYGFEQVVSDPFMVFRVWKGGMSFHGGLVGVLIALAVFAKRRQRRFADVMDFLAPLPGIGLCAGRIGNFINGELWGKPTDAPWGFVVDPSTLYPSQAQEAEDLCRRFAIDPCVLHVHPSQLYESALEGLLLFTIVWIFTAKQRPRLAPSGVFLLGYGVFRFLVEFVRVPDENRGYLLFGWVTMGQILSTPMIIAGLTLLTLAYRRREASGNFKEMVAASSPDSPRAVTA